MKKEVHNQKYVLMAKGHFRTFKVEYDCRYTTGRTRTFKTEDEANEFVDKLSTGAFYRVSQIDQVVKRKSS